MYFRHRCVRVASVEHSQRGFVGFPSAAVGAQEHGQFAVHQYRLVRSWCLACYTARTGGGKQSTVPGASSSPRTGGALPRHSCRRIQTARRARYGNCIRLGRAHPLPAAARTAPRLATAAKLPSSLPPTKMFTTYSIVTPPRQFEHGFSGREILRGIPGAGSCFCFTLAVPKVAWRCRGKPAAVRHTAGCGAGIPLSPSRKPARGDTPSWLRA